MIVEGPFLEGKLIQRYKRFLMDLRLEDGSITTVHCPNSGSMEGCLLEDAPVVASLGKGKNRKLSHTAEWIKLPAGWVGINTHRTNQIAGEALRMGRLPELASYTEVRSEVKYGKASRVDFLLTQDGLPNCYVEVKNTTLPMEGGAIAFPDAVTERGQKHLRELSRMVRQGHCAVMLYVVNRPDGEFFRPAKEKDPEYARLLRRAVKSGVEILVRRVSIDPPQAFLSDPLPIRI